MVAPSNTTPSIESATTIAPLPNSTGDSNDLAPSSVDANSETLPEPQPTDDIYPCDLADPPDWCEEPPPFWHPEVSATGWDEWSEWNNDNIGGGGGQGFAPATTVSRPTAQPPVVITTRTPTVIEIRTSVKSRASNVVGEGEATRLPEPASMTNGQTEQQTSLAQPTPGQQAPPSRGSGEAGPPQGSPPKPTLGQTAPGQMAVGSRPDTAQLQTVSSGSSLLDSIINQLGKAQPRARPVPVFAPTSGSSGELANHKPQTTLPTGEVRVEDGASFGISGAIYNPTVPVAAGTASAQNGIIVGDTVTLGSAILTLTPGLSTIIGTGSFTTLVTIQTDNASRTLITVSSSGTAITATITNAPATVTLPRTDFEVAVTSGAGRGVATPRPDVTAMTTTSRGTANEREAYIGRLSGFMLGILGIVLAS